MLKLFDLNDRIDYFVVSDSKEEGELFGLPVRCIKSVPKQEREDKIIIIASEFYYKEMEQTAAEMGFRNIKQYKEVFALADERG